MFNRLITTNKSKAIENWIIETLILHYQDIDKSQILEKLGISKALLKSKNIQPENVDRIYLGLFVYSKGFNELINQTIKDDILLKAQIWKVYVSLLEFYNTSNYKGILNKIINRNEQVQEEQKIYLDKLLEQIQNEKLLKEQQLQEWSQKQDQFENEIIHLNQLVKNENSKFQAAEQAHNSEFHKRIQYLILPYQSGRMEIKQSAINDIHEELKYKHELLIHNFAKSQKNLNNFLQKKEQIISHEIKLNQEINNLKHLIEEAKNRIFCLEHDKTKKVQIIDFMEKKIKEYERHIDDIHYLQQESNSKTEAALRNTIINESQIKEMKTHIQKLENENRIHQEQKTFIQDQNKQLLNELKAIKSQYGEIKQIKGQQSQQLVSLQTENETLKQQNEKLKQKSDEEVENKYEILENKFQFAFKMAHTLDDNRDIQVVTNKQLLIANQNLKWQLEQSQEQILEQIAKYKQLNESYITIEEHIVKQGNVFFQEKQLLEKLLDDKDQYIKKLQKSKIEQNNQINQLQEEMEQNINKLNLELEEKTNKMNDIECQNKLLLQQTEVQQSKEQLLKEQFLYSKNKKNEIEEKYMNQIQELQNNLNQVSSDYQQLQQKYELSFEQHQSNQVKLEQLQAKNKEYEKQIVELQGIEIEYDQYKEKTREQINDLQKQVGIQKSNQFINQQKLRERQSIIDILQQKQDQINQKSYMQESQLVQLKNKELQLQSENVNLKRRISRQSVLMEKRLSKTIQKRISKFNNIDSLISKQSEFTDQMKGIFAQLEALAQDENRSKQKIQKNQRKNFRRSQSFEEQDQKLQINESFDEDSSSSASKASNPQPEIINFNVSQNGKAIKQNRNDTQQREFRAKSQLIDIAEMASDSKSNHLKSKSSQSKNTQNSHKDYKRMRTSLAATSLTQGKEESIKETRNDKSDDIKQRKSKTDAEILQKNFQETREALIHQRVSLQFQKIRFNKRTSLLKKNTENQVQSVIQEYSPPQQINQSSYLNSRSHTIGIPEISKTTQIIKKQFARSASKDKQVDANEFKRIYRLSSDYYTNI